MKYLLCIFVPGIKGTRLYSTETKECLWPASRVLETWQFLFKKCDTQFSKLLLSDVLKDTENDTSIYVGDVLDKVKICGIYERDVYGKTIKQIKDIIKTEWPSFNGSLSVFNYDWRRSTNYCGKKLHDFIINERNRVLSKNSVTEEDIITVIIAHSYGGLITYNAIHRFLDIRLDRLMTVGTPHFGSRTSLRYLVGDGRWSLCSDETLFELCKTLDCLYDTLPTNAMSDSRIVNRFKLRTALERRYNLPDAEELYICENCPLIIHINVENVSRRIEGKICRGDGVVEAESCVLERNITDKNKLLSELKRATQHIKLLRHPYTISVFKKILAVDTYTIPK